MSEGTVAGAFTYECIHELDLRLHPRCYLCKPFGSVQGDYPGSFSTGGNFMVRCTCPHDRGDNYLGTCPIHDVAVTYTGWTGWSATNDGVTVNVEPVDG